MKDALEYDRMLGVHYGAVTLTDILSSIGGEWSGVVVCLIVTYMYCV